jgi:type IV pilus assembly protein PilM
MSFPIYLHDMKPRIDSGDSRVRDAARRADSGVSEERPSVWKRELSLGRRKKQPELEAGAKVDVRPDERVDVEPTASFDDAERQVDTERTSIWKRELSFGRKKHSEQESAADTPVPGAAAAAPDPVWEPQVELPPAPVEAPRLEEPTPWPVAQNLAPEPDAATEIEEPDQEVDADQGIEASLTALEERPSIWKRELSFGRKKQPADDARSDWEFGDHTDAEELAPAVEPTLEEPETETWHAPAEPPFEQPLEETHAFEETDQPDAGTDEGAKGSRKKDRKQRSPRGQRGGSSRGGKKLVGLRIGASQIAAAHVQSNGSHELLKVARTPLERGVVVAGELRDPDALASALRIFFKEHKLPKQGVRLGIASNRVGVRVLEVAGVDDPKLLGNAVRFRAQEVLPIPLSEAVLDYRVLRERTDDEGTLIREVLVAFAYRELVDRYTSVCRSAGLRLVGIDLDGFALLRALVDPNGDSGRLGGAAVVTVALGHDRSIMSVSDGAVCEFTRVIEWGGAALDTAVARILALTPSQAEPIKRELTLDRNAPSPEGLSPDQVGRARSAMVQEAHTFAREFVSSLQFYQAQPGSLDIGEIIVTGGTAHMPGLVEQLQELIGVTVRVGDPLSRVKVGKNVSTDDPVGSLALAIGLGIED